MHPERGDDDDHGADPDAGLGIGYAMNQMYANLRGDPRSLALLAAVYESL